MTAAAWPGDRTAGLGVAGRMVGRPDTTPSSPAVGAGSDTLAMRLPVSASITRLERVKHWDERQHAVLMAAFWQSSDCYCDTGIRPVWSHPVVGYASNIDRSRRHRLPRGGRARTHNELGARAGRPCQVPSWSPFLLMQIIGHSRCQRSGVSAPGPRRARPSRRSNTGAPIVAVCRDRACRSSPAVGAGVEFSFRSAWLLLIAASPCLFYSFTPTG